MKIGVSANTINKRSIGADLRQRSPSCIQMFLIQFGHEADGAGVVAFEAYGRDVLRHPPSVRPGL